MSDETQQTEDGAARELEREERRLVRLRSVIELHPSSEWAADAGEDFDPDPREAA